MLDPFLDERTPTQKIMEELDCRRRLRIVHIDPELVVKLATGRPFEVVNNPIPWDAEVVNSAYLPETHTFGVLLRHPSFKPVPDNECVPSMKGITYRENELCQ